MRKLLIVLVLLNFGCSSNAEKISNIEFMSYNWDLKYPTESDAGRFYIQPKLYSIINLNGENLSYICEFSPNKNEVYFDSKIDSKIVTQLINDLSLIKAEKNETPIDSYSYGGCVENSPTLRVKVIYADKSEKSYIYDFHKSNKVDLTLNKLYFALRINYIEEKFKKIKDTSFIARKKQAFIDFSMHSDTLILPLPELPSYKKVKFLR
jgi:hypothetical protein